MDTLNDIISELKWGDLDPIEAHDRVLALFSVSKSVATEYAEFCVRCDRDKLPLLCLEDCIKQFTFTQFDARK